MEQVIAAYFTRGCRLFRRCTKDRFVSPEQVKSVLKIVPCVQTKLCFGNINPLWSIKRIRSFSLVPSASDTCHNCRYLIAIHSSIGSIFSNLTPDFHIRNRFSFQTPTLWLSPNSVRGYRLGVHITIVSVFW